MARKSGGRDWQERAFDEVESKRRDKAKVPNPLKPASATPRRSSWRATLIAVLIVVAAVIIRVDLNNRSPSLTTSCTTPAFAFSTSDPGQGSLVRWSATGPANVHFLIALGIARLGPGRAPGQVHGVPEPGHTAATTQVAVNPTVLSSDCKAHGVFRVGVAPGAYGVRMFRLDGTGSGVTGTEVAAKQLTVKS